MECSGPHDSRELLQSPKNGQAKGQKGAHRLSQSFRLENPTELRPKSIMGGQLNESIFLLSSRPTPRTSAMVELNPGEGEDPSSPQKTSPLSKMTSGHLSQGALESQMRELIYTDSDLVITPIIDNPKIMKQPAIKFDPKILHLPAYSGHVLHTRSQLLMRLSLPAVGFPLGWWPSVGGEASGVLGPFSC